VAAASAAAHERRHLILYRVRDELLHSSERARELDVGDASGRRHGSVPLVRRQHGRALVRPERHDHGHVPNEEELCTAPRPHHDRHRVHSSLSAHA